MSTYGNEPPPQDPYGQQPPNPYGAQPPPPPPPPPTGPPNPYGAQPNPYGGQQAPAYDAAGYAAQGYGGAPAYDYAHWGKRVGAYLIDGLLTALAAIPLFIGYGILISKTVGSTTYDTTTGTYVTTGDSSGGGISLILILIGFVTYLGFFIWNTCIKQGKTGYSIGKGVMGIKLVNEASGQPIGGGMAFVRQLAHILDSFCYVGFLWPLWDAKKQTFADKVLSTVVFNAPKP